MTGSTLAHRGQQPEREAHRREVVDVDGPLEVVEAIGRLGDAAVNRPAGVVDEDVGRAVLAQDTVGQFSDGVEVREVARQRDGGAVGAVAVEVVDELLQAVCGAGHEQRGRPCADEAACGRFADPERRAGEQHDAALDRVPQFVVAHPDMPVRRQAGEAIGE
ncbi:hypothetical protein LRS13_02405 [Svornostia abyssi]|uniref:Uncharacterized protein n=1 Tax=Svornostia abyssi TaxID=2898438 RepID=A0ABY5PI96_9ACTN|nr:hypothetical protein LRS13_02405 [Parviterribacteraceae bacterium J379]